MNVDMLYSRLKGAMELTYYTDIHQSLKIGIDRFLSAYDLSKGAPNNYEIIEAIKVFNRLFTVDGLNLIPKYTAIPKAIRDVKYQELVVQVERTKAAKKKKKK